jgi:hypothetical protein
VPDNELFLDCLYAFDFSKALPVFHRVPKTVSNFYKPIIFSSPQIHFRVSLFVILNLFQDLPFITTDAETGLPRKVLIRGSA